MQQSQRKLGRLVIAALLIGFSFTANAAQIRVSQESTAGAGDFDANVLGNIDTYSTPLTISQFYQYNVPNFASYNGELNGGPGPISSLTQSFFVEASDGLHYVVVHDNPNDGSGGRTRMTTVLAGGAGGSTAYTVEDDPGEGTAISDVGGDRIFDTAHGWAGCCTDGYAIGDLGLSFLMLARFDEQPTGIDRWQATSELGNLALVLEEGRRVRFDAVVPVPAAVWLFGTALVGLFGFNRRKKSA